LFVTANVAAASLEHEVYYNGMTAYYAAAKTLNDSIVVPKRPESERTVRNKNIIMAVATHRVILEITTPDRIVQAKASSEAMLESLGVPLNCTERNPDLATGDCIAIAIANLAADQTIAINRRNGLNRLGDEGGRTYHKMPYSDWTEYVPSNLPGDFKNMDLWEPHLVVEPLKNKINYQSFLTPQLGYVTPFAVDPETVTFPNPRNRYYGNRHSRDAYFDKIEDVIDELAITATNDTRKVVGEYFDNKPLSFGTMLRYLYGSDNGQRSLQIDNFVATAPAMQLAMYEAMKVAWYHKRNVFDTARPYSLIRKWKKGKLIPGWGGPGKGRVMLKGEEWSSYMPTDYFPDDPSGTSCIAWAFAGAAQTLTGSDQWGQNGFTYVFKQGDSIVEPGITPAQPITLHFDTFSEMAELASVSRVWGGVHTRSATTMCRDVCREVGVKVAQKFTRLFRGL
jgi:hypothetical protein